jgi:hypothetical protein
MSKNNEASVSNVGQTGKNPRKKGPLRTIKISFRATEKMSTAKPPEQSWSEHVERLQTLHSRRDPYASTRTRYAAWAAVTLDGWAREVAECLRDGSGIPIEMRLNRLEVLAKLLHGIAAVRSEMEEMIHAG